MERRERERVAGLILSVASMTLDQFSPLTHADFGQSTSS